MNYLSEITTKINTLIHGDPREVIYEHDPLHDWRLEFLTPSERLHIYVKKADDVDCAVSPLGGDS